MYVIQNQKILNYVDSIIFMINRGKNHLGIDRSKTAGGRARRQAHERKKSLQSQNLYKITVRKSVANKVKNGAVYGLYKEKSKWFLTAMAVRRTVERLVSDRRGGTSSEIVDEFAVTKRPNNQNPHPRDGLVLSSHSTKKEALKKVSAEKSKKVNTGEYIVFPKHWERNMKIHKVDRDKYREFFRQRVVRNVK